MSSLVIFTLYTILLTFPLAIVYSFIFVFCFHRVLADAQTKLGEEYILSAFPFENDKYSALSVLHTVSVKVFKLH